MYGQILLLACILFTSMDCITAKMPEYLRPCKQNSELSKCLKENWEAARKFLLSHDGDEALHIKNIIKLSLPTIPIAITPQLDAVLINNTFTGLDTCALHEITLDDNVLQIQGHCKELKTEGPYTMHGRLLVLPIEGDGEFNLTLSDFGLNYTAKLQREERKGKTYYYTDADSEHTTLEFSNIGHARVYFGNLFGGDPQIELQMNTLFNEYWKDLIQETLPGLEYFNAAHIFNPIINAYLRRIPISELFEK